MNRNERDSDCRIHYACASAAAAAAASVGRSVCRSVRSFICFIKKCNCVYIIKIRSMLCNIHIIYTMYMTTNSMHEEYMKRFDKHFRTEKWHQQRIRIHCFLVVCKTFNNKRKSKSKVRMNHHPTPAPASPSMSTHPYAAAPPRRTHESCVRRRMFGRKKKKSSGYVWMEQRKRWQSC